MKNRHTKDPFEPQERFNGLSQADFGTLSRYNSECNRGIMHTDEWRERMERLQKTLDDAERKKYEEWHASVRPLQEVVHMCPPGGEQLTACCWQTPFDLPRYHRMTNDVTLVTCEHQPKCPECGANQREMLAGVVCSAECGWWRCT